MPDPIEVYLLTAFFCGHVEQSASKAPIGASLTRGITGMQMGLD
jgi:hypothetical protein